MIVTDLLNEAASASEGDTIRQKTYGVVMGSAVPDGMRSLRQRKQWNAGRDGSLYALKAPKRQMRMEDEVGQVGVS